MGEPPTPSLPSFPLPPMAPPSNLFAAVFLLLALLTAPRVSAQTHHVVAGWGPDLDLGSWLSGRVFTVGDKLWFKYAGSDESIVELEELEDFVSCNLTNPIKMYTDPVEHVALDKEGVRYFTSGNPDNCKNGLKLTLPVHPADDHHDPHPPFKPTPPFEPPPFPSRPPPSPPPHHKPPPPSAAGRLDVVSAVLSAGWWLYYVAM